MDNLQEQWRPVPEFEGIYEASNQGRVRSLDRIVSRSDGAKQPWRGRVLKGTLDPWGYPCVTLHRSGKSYTRRVHRVIAATWFGPRGEDIQINHIDGDKANNAIRNLEYVTQSENVQHAYANGMMARERGEAHHMAKLTDDDVRLIRHLAGAVSHRKLARRFGVSKGNITFIVQGRTWRHLL